MPKIELKVPNIGEFKDVEIIEVLVSNEDNIKKNDPLITIESDKSSVEIPSTEGGKIISINLKVGDKVSEGDKILEIETLNVSQIKQSNINHDIQEKKQINKIEKKVNETKVINKVSWQKIDNFDASHSDVWVVHNDPNLLDLIPSNDKKILWLTSSGLKLARPENFSIIMKHKPTLIIQGEYHINSIPEGLKSLDATIIPTGQSNYFINIFMIKAYVIVKVRIIIFNFAFFYNSVVIITYIKPI